MEHLLPPPPGCPWLWPALPPRVRVCPPPSGVLGPSLTLQGSDRAGRGGATGWEAAGAGTRPGKVPWPPRSRLGQGGPSPPCSAQCSAPCGGGVQRRLVRCVNTQTGLPEEDSEQCGHEAWPESSRPCGAQDCELAEAPRESAAPCAGSGWGGPGDGILGGPWRMVRLRARAKGAQPHGAPRAPSRGREGGAADVAPKLLRGLRPEEGCPERAPWPQKVASLPGSGWPPATGSFLASCVLLEEGPEPEVARDPVHTPSGRRAFLVLLSTGSWAWTHTWAPGSCVALASTSWAAPRPGQGGESKIRGCGQGPGGARGRGSLSVRAAAVRSGRELRASSVSGGTLAASVPLSRCPPPRGQSLRLSGWPSVPQGLAPLPSRCHGLLAAPVQARGEAALPCCPALLPSQGPRPLQGCRLPCRDAGPLWDFPERPQHLPPGGGPHGSSPPSHWAPGPRSLGGWAVPGTEARGSGGRQAGAGGLVTWRNCQASPRRHSGWRLVRAGHWNPRMF